MKEFNYTITDKEGIHMRPAGELVKAAKQFESSILIKKDGKTADCKKVFTIMSLAVKCGQEVTVKVEGSDEEQAAAKIETSTDFNPWINAAFVAVSAAICAA